MGKQQEEEEEQQTLQTPQKRWLQLFIPSLTLCRFEMLPGCIDTMMPRCNDHKVAATLKVTAQALLHVVHLAWCSNFCQWVRHPSTTGQRCQADHQRLVNRNWGNVSSSSSGSSQRHGWRPTGLVAQ